MLRHKMYLCVQKQEIYINFNICIFSFSYVEVMTLQSPEISNIALITIGQLRGRTYLTPPSINYIRLPT